MVYKVEKSLEFFEAWSGGRDTLNVLIDRGDCDTVEQALIEIYGDDITETQVNDILWFDTDWIAEMLGYDDWESYVTAGEDE